MKNKENTGIVIPYFNAKDHIVSVVKKAVEYSSHIVIVNDCSLDKLPVKELSGFSNVTIIKTQKNIGVGGATKLGFEFLEKIKQVRVIVKLDADDQMDTSFIPELVKPIFNNRADFVKGNRFRDYKALNKMPKLRRFGNLFLSFLSKVATGYWHCFDFNNGFFAISTKSLKQINKLSLANNYFFETSLIGELYFQRAGIKEIAMPAIYGDEKSNMSLVRMPFLFSINLFKKFIKRILKAYFIYDFNIGTIYLLFGLPMFIGGIIYGAYKWWYFLNNNLLAPLGTIMISSLLIILGFQLVLQAIQFDIMNTPKTNNE